jgi:hypothetical protein
MSFSSLLRCSTNGDHERIEVALGIPDRLHSEADLARLLIAWDTVWADVRAGVQLHRRPAGHDERARLLVSAVRAMQRIRADLAELGPETVRPGPKPGDAPGSGLPDGDLADLLAAEPGVWAVSYVLRGSRLGGGVFAPLVGERFELPLGVATAYYRDEAAGPSWISFRRRLDAWGRVAREDDCDQALDLTGTVFALVSARLTAALPPAGRTA